MRPFPLVAAHMAEFLRALDPPPLARLPLLIG
jgi:hypothetical protein